MEWGKIDNKGKGMLCERRLLNGERGQGKW